MKLNKPSFAVGNLFGAATLVVVLTGCGKGDLLDSTAVQSVVDQPQASQNYGSIQAKNIILTKEQIPQGRVIKIQANQLPSDVQVLASQVTVVNTSNTLQSTNLQTALDTELAVDIATNIVGVWDIKNYGGEDHWATLDGRVEFKPDGTYQLISGGFAVAGKIARGTEGWFTGVNPTPDSGSRICVMPDFTGYEVVEGAVIFKASAGGNGLAVVAKNTVDSITMIGSGGCGAQGVQRITKLTRVTTAAPASLKSNPSKYTPPKPVGKVALAG